MNTFSQSKPSPITGLLYFLLLITTLTLTNYGCCAGVDCDVDVDRLELNFLRNGEDIIFGDTPIVDIMDIDITNQLGNDVFFLNGTNQIMATLRGGEIYNVRVGDVVTFTIQGEIEQINNSGCCGEFQFSTFRRDGQVICDSECTELNFEI